MFHSFCCYATFAAFLRIRSLYTTWIVVQTAFTKTQSRYCYFFRSAGVRIFDFARDRGFDFAVKFSMYAGSPGILPIFSYELHDYMIYLFIVSAVIYELPRTKIYFYATVSDFVPRAIQGPWLLIIVCVAWKKAVLMWQTNYNGCNNKVQKYCIVLLW